MKFSSILFSTIILGGYFSSCACTVFYASDGDMVLGGNNEDYSDSNTSFFIYPAENGKHGWVKFGYMGGWPQGGMNDQGLFWDATACSYLEMPYSEANKIRYIGPLMQKVMEECSTFQEALGIFEKYYCDDQYKGQYLLGDTTGTSVIIEGDSYIIKKKNYQILTNFYQSHPDLGGYPCWRYDTAESMLQSTNKISTNLFGTILSATHQEGRYPTQYSNIYDLKRKIVYLFYFHNFEEFISINLKEIFSKEQKIFSMKPLFSQIKILGPPLGSTVTPSSVTFRWQGNNKSEYYLYCSIDSSFSNCKPIPAGDSNSNNISRVHLGVLILCILFIGNIRGKGKKSYLYRVAVIVTMCLLISCQGKVTTPEKNNNIQEMRISVEGLEKKTIYYWKVVAKAEGMNDFTSETPVRNFITTY